MAEHIQNNRIVKNAKHVSAVIRFAFFDFEERVKVDDGKSKKKWFAKCNKCKKEYSEMPRTTSAFTR